MLIAVILLMTSCKKDNLEIYDYAGFEKFFGHDFALVP